MKNIECIINPKSIAVVGATNRAGSVGLATFKNLMQPTSVMRLPQEQWLTSVLTAKGVQ